MLLTQQEKEFLQCDLTARANCFVKVLNTSLKEPEIQTLYGIIQDKCIMYEAYISSTIEREYRQYGGYIPAIHYTCLLEHVKPYLRPLSAMTKKEMNEFKHIAPGISVSNGIKLPNARQIDWLNTHHFDYRTSKDNKTMIEAGLAIEAPDGMYDC